jgi:hypothetical protein
MKRVRALLCVCLLATLTACSNNPSTSPTPAPPQTFTEVFSGTLGRNGAFSQSFVAQSSGMVTATLSSIAPDAAQVVGLTLGTWTGSACQTVIANDNATLQTTVTGTVGSAGALCVRVYDVGRIAENTQVSVQVTVIHP